MLASPWLKSVSSKRREQRQRFFHPTVQSLEDRRLLATITGRLWLDADINGVQDAGETTNFSGVTVSATRFGNTLFATTNANGVYTFNGVAEGSYDLAFNLPANNTLTPTDVGEAGFDVANDGDFNTATAGGTVASKSIFFNVGQTTVDVDAGLAQAANLEVFCWDDVNGNGQQDAGAPEANGLAGVTLTLQSNTYASQGPTSVVNGLASFTRVRPGTFFINAAHSTFVLTTPNVGNDALDSDVIAVSAGVGNSGTFALNPGQTRTDIDVGFLDEPITTGSITGLIWLDSDGDGIREGGENSLTGNYTFTLKNAAGDTTVTSDTTDANFTYLFTGVAAGSYYLVVNPGVHPLTLQNQGGNDTLDSDFNVNTLRSQTFTVTAGGNVTSIDAGVISGTATIGDLVWLDTDNDGLKDAGEAGLAGANVVLFNTQNQQVGSSIVTTASGLYQFSGLDTGTYYVRVTPPLGYIPTLRDQGANDNIDSDIIPNQSSSNFRTQNITVTAGQSQLKWDAGFVHGAKVGDKVWLDTNRNGRQDAGEPGRQGVAVKLKTAGADGNLGTADDVVLKQTTTNANGIYRFNGVDNGIYYVEFVRPGGFVFTLRNVGGDNLDSDAGHANGRTPAFTILNRADNLSLDAGLIPSATIHVHVGDDNDCDGDVDPGEHHAGVELVLIDTVNGIVGDHDDVEVGTGITDANGNYQFRDLGYGRYVVQAHLPRGWHFISPGADSDITTLCDCGCWGYTTVIVVNPSDVINIDVGLCPEDGVIEGTVWNDANRNRVRDGGLIRGALPDIVLAIDVSGSTSDLFAGTSVGDVNGDGFANTILDAEIQAGIALNQQLIAAGYGSLVRFSIVTFSNAAQKLDMNPAQANVQVSTRPQTDADNNGVLDVVQVLKTLRSGGATNYEAALMQTINTFNILGTDPGEGNLLFLSDGVPTTGGTFDDEVDALLGMGVNLRAFGVGADAALDQLQIIDPFAEIYDSGDDLLAAFNLNNNTAGFPGERGMAGVHVFLDLNSNGVLNAGEPRMLTLSDDPDTPDVDESGTYRFTDLAPGTYKVRELLPSGYSQTWPGPSQYQHVVTLEAGETKSGRDFGNAANPAITGVPSTRSFSALTPIWLASGAVVGDLDTPTLAGGTLRVRISNNAQTTDTVYISAPTSPATGQISVSGNVIKYGTSTIGTFTGGTGAAALLITLNGNATLTAVQALARKIAFYNSLASPPTAARTIEWRLTDGTGGTSALVNQTVNIV